MNFKEKIREYLSEQKDPIEELVKSFSAKEVYNAYNQNMSDFYDSEADEEDDEEYDGNYSE